MNSTQEWILAEFLKSLADIKLFTPEPLHRIALRLQLADMVLSELPGNDVVEVASRAHAEALRDLYLTDDPRRRERYEEELRAFTSVVIAAEKDDE
jgi:hypothetical protein